MSLFFYMCHSNVILLKIASNFPMTETEFYSIFKIHPPNLFKMILKKLSNDMSLNTSNLVHIADPRRTIKMHLALKNLMTVAWERGT